MTAVAATAMVLECFFGQLADGSVPADSVARVRVPVSGAVADSLIARRPPENAGHFEGEAGGLHEWLIAGTRDPAASRFRGLRVSLSVDQRLPSPYAARLGTIQVSPDRTSSRFEQQASGWCQLRPSESVPQ